MHAALAWDRMRTQVYALLNCDDHAHYLRKHKKDPALYRPDICHQASKSEQAIEASSSSILMAAAHVCSLCCLRTRRGCVQLFAHCAGTAFNFRLPTVQSWQGQGTVYSYAQERLDICEPQGKASCPVRSNGWMFSNFGTQSSVRHLGHQRIPRPLALV